MRKLLLVLLGLLMIPHVPVCWAVPKHVKKLQEKVSELGHKKRMKKAAKQDPNAAKHFQLHK